MNTISTSSSYSTSASTNKGMSGMVSGLDTEAMVEDMLSGTQAKIDEQKGKQQQVTWKQEIIRELITQINSFKNAFFSSTSSTNLLSSTFFNTMAAVTTSKAFEVVASSSASAGKTTVRVDQLATSAKMESGMAVSGEISGKINLDSLKSTVESGGKPSFLVQLNGVSKTIELDGLSSDSTYDDVEQEIQSKLDSAFGKGWMTVKVDDATGKFSLNLDKKGSTVKIGGDSSGLSLLGVTEGISNKVNRNLELKNLNFGVDLQGRNFTFSINDVEFSFDDNATINDIIKEVNNSNAGVRMTYNDIEDKFVLESTETGAGREIKLSQTEGNLLNVMFGNAEGLVSGSTASSNAIYRNETKGDSSFGINADGEINSGVFKVVVNGTAHTISIPKKEDDSSYTREEIKDEINKQLNAKFGTVSGKQAIELIENPDGSYKMAVRNGAKVEFAKEAVYEGDTDKIDVDATNKKATGGELALLFGFNGSSNVVEDSALPSVKLSDLGIGVESGDSIKVGSETLTGNATVEELMQAFEKQGVSASVKDGKIVLEATSADEKTIEISGGLEDLFGCSGKLVFNGKATDGTGGAVGDMVFTEGKNAVAVIDGMEIERSSNTFTVNGLTITLKETTKGEEPEVVDVSRDTDKVVDGIKAFVEQYNELIEKINGLVDAEATYKEYAPLTEAQKKEMSDREIELWEEKAKEGLLRNNSDLESFTSAMRSILYSMPEGCELALYNIGIETSSEWQDKGKLTIDESKLRSMLESNAQDIQELFAGENGIANQLLDVINATANTSSGSPGSLVSYAGVKNSATVSNNTLSEELKRIAEKLEKLQYQYENEKNRYWKQFNTMEQALSNMNTQIMWLSQQFA